MNIWYSDQPQWHISYNDDDKENEYDSDDINNSLARYISWHRCKIKKHRSQSKPKKGHQILLLPFSTLPISQYWQQTNRFAGLV